MHYYKGTSFGWVTAQAGASAAQGSYLLGFAIGTDPDVDGIMLQGVVAKGSHGLTPGAPIYLSTTAGAMTNTAPTGNGEFVRIIGYALDADTIYFDPDKTFVERTS